MGGGSGGHVTPVVAILREIHKEYPRARVRFWCDRHFADETRAIFSEYDKSVQVQTIIAGKFRRYHNLSKLQHLTIPSIIFPNIRDAFWVVFGVGQSFFRMLFWRPDVVFAKGGYVCLPVGIAAWLLRIPVVIHDSDAHPGLTNRLLVPFAKRIATGMPLENYDYPKQKTEYVGIPIDPSYKILSEKRRSEVKSELGFDSKRPLVVITGGGQGARSINDAVALHMSALLKHSNVLLLSGSAQYDELRSITPQNDPRFVLKDFVHEGLFEILGAADVVVSRAGATSLLELAAVARPTIVVPSKRLIWQVKHAQVYVDSDAVMLLDEDKFVEQDDTSLVDAIKKILGSKPLQHQLGQNLHKHAKPRAAYDMASIILNTKKRG